MPSGGALGGVKTGYPEVFIFNYKKSGRPGNGPGNAKRVNLTPILTHYSQLITLGLSRLLSFWKPAMGRLKNPEVGIRTAKLSNL
jgi:hypothetical protein